MKLGNLFSHGQNSGFDISSGGKLNAGNIKVSEVLAAGETPSKAVSIISKGDLEVADVTYSKYRNDGNNGRSMRADLKIQSLEGNVKAGDVKISAHEYGYKGSAAAYLDIKSAKLVNTGDLSSSAVANYDFGRGGDWNGSGVSNINVKGNGNMVMGNINATKVTLDAGGYTRDIPGSTVTVTDPITGIRTTTTKIEYIPTANITANNVKASNLIVAAKDSSFTKVTATKKTVIGNPYTIRPATTN
jgi:hypothetical protein